MRLRKSTLILFLLCTALLSASLAPLPATAQNTSTTFEVGAMVQNFNGDTATLMHQLGLTWVKWYARMGDSQGANSIKTAHDAGFKILFTVRGDGKQVLTPGYFDQYADFVAGLAAAGADGIEVWDQANMAFNNTYWTKGKINPALYAQLLSAAYPKIKAANANTLVISGAPAPTGSAGASGKSADVWNDDVYYAGMAAAKAASHLDCIGVRYSEGALSPSQTKGDKRDNFPTRYYSLMLNRAMKPFGDKPACFTSLGYLSPDGFKEVWPGFEWAKKTTAAQQGQWIAEAVTLAQKSGNVRLMIINNLDYTTNDAGAGYALIRPDKTCPACDALAKVLPPVSTPSATVATATMPATTTP